MFCIIYTCSFLDYLFNRILNVYFSGSQGSGINQWQSLSDSGGSGSGGAGTDSPQSPFRRPRSRSLR